MGFVVAGGRVVPRLGSGFWSGWGRKRRFGRRIKEKA